MKRIIETRRDFIKNASVALTLPLILGCRTNGSAQLSNDKVLKELRANAITDSKDEWWGARSVPDNVTSKATLFGADDKAERITITGTVYKADGKTPAPNTLIYLYHTDVHGIYGQSGEHRHGRYRGWMLTDERGRYEFASILPASYPNSTIAKHIHMTITTLDRKEDYVDSILFDGDRFLTARDRAIDRGGFDPVLKLAKGSDGVSRGVRDIRLWV